MLSVCCVLTSLESITQAKADSIFSFRMYDDVRLTFDYTPGVSPAKEAIIILYALPNGNTTEQTMGKKLQPGDDWHFDVQHIRAQTRFIRNALRNQNVVVVYLENDLRSWPAWKQKHNNYLSFIRNIVDTLYHFVPSRRKTVYLSGHSGGGSFIFGYVAAVNKIPDWIGRISFLDSDYGYDSSYFPKFKDWLAKRKNAHLTVFAYNDSVALYNGKPVVSATGGTWYRSHSMLNDLSKDFSFVKVRQDSVTVYESSNKQIGFFFKDNPDRGIYHTQQVEFNGFIHSVLFGTKRSYKRYKYYGPRAYVKYVQ